MPDKDFVEMVKQLDFEADDWHEQIVEFNRQYELNQQQNNTSSVDKPI